MLFSQYFVEFIFYSFLGWVWESIYCTAREHHWMDRGFLFGPYCPIYGSCVVGAEILFTHILPWNMQEMSVIAIFIISYVGSAIVEYVTSYLLEKRFHARWWDYSYMPLNINGRICVPASIGFGLAGVLCVKVLIPWMSGLHESIPGLAYEGTAIILAMVFGADFALTEASLNSLLKRLEEYKADFNERAQETYVKLAEAPEVIQAAIAEEREDMRQRREEWEDEIKAKSEEISGELRARGEELSDEFKQRNEERRIRRDELTEAFLGKLNGFQKSKLKNMKIFVPKIPEDSIILEKLREWLDK